MTIQNAWLPALQRAVRLYLGAVTLADIVSDGGYYIMDWALTGQPRAKPMIPWPNQGKPTNICW
eukprot:3357964-Ditylum_brightwellii.AAC.1